MSATAEEENLLSLPSTKEALQQALKHAMENNSKHLMTLQMAHTSHIYNRSLNQASILLLGNSGSGKSSTINHLFGKTYMKVSDDESCTRETVEWIAESNSEILMVKNLTLSIIDTPGLLNTDGDEQDVRNLSTIKEFFATHQNFEKGTLRPNFIFLVVNAEDRRMIGKYSELSKTLKAVGTLEIVDKVHSNVVVVLTHTMSGGEECFQQRNAKVAENVLELCKIYLGVIPVHVLIENNPKAHKLREENWLTILPNNEKQPLNIFKQALKLTGKHDPIGFLTLTHFLECLEHTDLQKGHSVNHVQVLPLALNWKESNEHKNNEFKNYLIKWVNQNMDPNSDRTIMVELNHLISALREHDLDSEEKIRVKNLCQIAGAIHPFSINSRMKDILTGAFNLHRGIKSNDLHLRIGQSYDIFSDSIKKKLVYVHNNKNRKVTEYGFEINSNVNLFKESNTRLIAESFKTQEDYVKYHLGKLNVHINVADNWKAFFFAEAPKAGCSYSGTSKGERKSNHVSFLVESCLFKLALDLNAKTISEEFKKAVMRLPEEYDKSDSKNVKKFSSFFKTWGHYVITEQNVGGHVQGVMDTQGTIAERQARASINLKMAALFSAGGSSQESGGNAKIFGCTKLEWKGGDERFHASKFDVMDKQQWESWNDSLNDNLVVLDSKQLEPITDSAKEVDEDRGCALEDAFEDLMKVKVIKEDGETRTGTTKNTLNKVLWDYPGVTTIAIVTSVGALMSFGKFGVGLAGLGAFVLGIMRK